MMRSYVRSYVYILMSFANCIHLTRVVIPASVTKIENNLFQDCLGLETIYFAGTRSQWQAIEIGEENTRLKSVQVICESTGPETAE